MNFRINKSLIAGLVLAPILASCQNSNVGEIFEDGSGDKIRILKKDVRCSIMADPNFEWWQGGPHICFGTGYYIEDGQPTEEWSSQDNCPDEDVVCEAAERYGVY